MPHALTIFVAGRADRSRFAYAMMKPVSGLGPYRRGALPKHGIQPKQPIAQVGAFEIHAWDKIVDGPEEAALLSDLASGSLTLPNDCPFEFEHSLDGVPFGAVEVDIDAMRATFECRGGGMLFAKTFIAADGAEGLVRELRADLGRDNIGTELNLLLETIARESGLVGFVDRTRRLRGVDLFHRAIKAGDGSPILCSLVKPSLETTDPATTLRLIRASWYTKPVTVAVRLGCNGEWIEHRLVQLAAGESERSVTAANHITEAELDVFAEDGSSLDCIRVGFLQSIATSFSLQTGVDDLPPIAGGAVPDLDTRVRHHAEPPSTLAGGTGRSGGIEALVGSRGVFDRIAGRADPSLESFWVAAGPEARLDVIRWFKSRMEENKVREIIIADPFLDTAALKRVVLRSGREDLSITLLVSPAGVDPEADETDKPGKAEEHVRKLCAVADEIADKLCGEVEILHVKRGMDSKQAFHDRYLCTVDREGRPTVYLLSNSLNNAAGQWPFAVSQLSQAATADVFAYLQNLRLGKEGKKKVSVERVWSTKNRSAAARSPKTVAKTAPRPRSRDCKLSECAQMLYHTWWTSCDAGPDRIVEDVAKTLVANLHECVPDASAEEMAGLLYAGVGGSERDRDALISVLEAGSSIERQAAALLSDRIADEAVEAILDEDGWRARRLDQQTERIGARLALREKPTDFVRARLNGRLEQSVSMLEVARVPLLRRTAEAHRAAVILAVGLSIAKHADGVNETFRAGLSTDYVHWLGRLAQSSGSSLRRPYIGSAAFNCALDLAKELGARWPVVGEAVQIIRTDPNVPENIRVDLAVN